MRPDGNDTSQQASPSRTVGTDAGSAGPITDPDGQLLHSPAEFAAVARALTEADGILAALQQLVEAAVPGVPCDFAAVAVTDELGDRPARLAASTDPALAQLVAAAAVEAGASPGISAFEGGLQVLCSDLVSDPGPERVYEAYGRILRARTPIASVLATPLQIDGTTIGVLTLYAAHSQAFDPDAAARAHVLTDHAAIAVESAMLQDEAENLHTALLRSRVIGQAQGILIERFRLTPDEAFARLRRSSQQSNRKVSEIADELVRTGAATGVEVAD